MINNPISLGEWLASRPAQTLQLDAAVIAHRTALRFFPLWAADLATGRTGGVDRKCLKVARVHLCLSVALRERSVEAIQALKRACEADRKIVVARAGLVPFSGSDDDAIAACVFALESYERMATKHLRAGTADLWASVEADAQELDRGSEILTRPVWGTTFPEWFTARHEAATAHWRTKPQTWDFWLRWWEGVVSGRQVDLDVRRRVAAIPDKVWRKGPEVVAEAIRGIEACNRLRLQAEAHRQELERLLARLSDHASSVQRSHNHPPELIDAPGPILIQISDLVATLATTEAELSKPKPAKPLLRRLATKLQNGAQSVIQYFGGLADAAFQEGAKSVGKSAGGVLIVYLGSEPVLQAVASLAEAIAKLP